MKTTVEIPEKTLRRAKTLADAKGVSLEQLLAEAIEDKVRHGEELRKGAPRWMKLYGAFAKSEDMRNDTRSIQKIIDEEFLPAVRREVFQTGCVEKDGFRLSWHFRAQ